MLSGFPGSPKLISVNGTNVFNSNFGDGLVIETTDIVTTNNLTGNGNTNGDGAYIDNCFYISGQCLVSGAPTLTMTGTNIFNGNSAGGLQAISYGNITAANLNVSGNTTYGVWLFNNLSTSATTPVPSKGTVTLTGTNIFNSNTSDGLDVESNRRAACLLHPTVPLLPLPLLLLLVPLLLLILVPVWVVDPDLDDRADPDLVLPSEGEGEGGVRPFEKPGRSGLLEL